MFFVCSKQAILIKYGSAGGAAVFKAVDALGPVLDVSNLSPAQIRGVIASQAPGPACLIGGYDLLPTFSMSNPSRSLVQDPDAEVFTDAPYGARVGSLAECYLPSRPVCRIPDAGGKPSANDFIAQLNRAAGAPNQKTPDGCFEEAADEFAGSAQLVHALFATLSAPPPRLSPPVNASTPGIEALISGQGRIHFLLHGASTSPGWAMLSGRANAGFVNAMSARQLQQCELSGSIVSFSSCYATMLDSTRPADGPRTPDNQVALACLKAGAKAVFGATRANWIDIQAPFDSYGPALVAHLWKHLGDGAAGAEALRAAKWSYLKEALKMDPWGRPYALKTVLQAHCFGHPMVKL